MFKVHDWSLEFLVYQLVLPQHPILTWLSLVFVNRGSEYGKYAFKLFLFIHNYN